MTSKLVNKTFLFTLVIILVQTKSETIIESNTYKPIAVQITDSTFFTFTEDISFVYDVNTGKSTNKLTHTTISSQDMQKASIICNSKNIYVSVSGTLYVYETTGALLGEANFDSDLSSVSNNPVKLTLKSDYSIFAMDNGNVVVSQIVFVNKSEDGATEVYSLYDFKDFRENMDAEKGYIQGRFDAVPYVDSSVDNIKQLLEE